MRLRIRAQGTKQFAENQINAPKARLSLADVHKQTDISQAPQV